MSIAFLRYSGGYNVGDPPLPIPNREVKPNGADGTASQWESRMPPFLRSVRERGDRISPSSPEKKGEGESLESEALSFFIFSLSKNHFAFLSIPLSPFPAFPSSFSFLPSFFLHLPFLFSFHPQSDTAKDNRPFAFLPLASRYSYKVSSM